MAGNGESAEAKPNQPVEGPKPVDAGTKPELNPKADAGNGIDKMKDKAKEKTEADKKQKEERRELIKKNASTLRIPEAWVGPNYDGVDKKGSGFIQDQIDSKVEEKFAQYEAMLKEYGLGDATNIGIMKDAAKELVARYYGKSSDVMATDAYFSGPMKEKMMNLFKGMDKLYKSKKYPYSQPLDMITAFSDFTGFNFIQNGVLNKENLKKTLTQQPSVFDAMNKHFEEYLNLGVDIQKLSVETVNADKDKPLDIGKLFAEGKLTLNGTPKLTVFDQNVFNNPSSSSTEVSLAGSTLIAGIQAKLPANMDKSLVDKTTNWLIAEAKKMKPGVGEGLILKENGKWEIYTLAQDAEAKKQAETMIQTAAADNPTGAPAGDATGTPTDAPAGDASSDNPLETKTGIGWLDKIMEFFSKYFTQLFSGGVSVLAAKTGLNKYVEYMGLSDDEKKVAQEFKKVAMGAGLNEKTLIILLSDSDETKKVLAKAKESKLNWNEYLAKYLDSTELDFLKKEQTVPAKKISDMLLSEKK